MQGVRRTPPQNYLLGRPSWSPKTLYYSTLFLQLIHHHYHSGRPQDAPTKDYYESNLIR